jgi:hypothetical protein
MTIGEHDSGEVESELDGIRQELIGDLDPNQLSLAEICKRCATVASVAGAGLQLTANTFAGAVAASDERTQQLEDLQFILGQGPVVDVFSSGAEVLVEDLAKTEERWPEFTPGALKIGVRAMFSLPLRFSHRAGSLTFYKDDPGEPDPVAAVRMRRLARLVTEIVLGYPTDTVEDGLGRSVRDAAVRRDQLNQAAGIVSVTIDGTPADALSRLRAHTYASGDSLDVVIQAVLDRQLRFEP